MRIYAVILTDTWDHLQKASNDTEMRPCPESYMKCYVACNTTITVKHMLVEYADLLEVRKKYFEGRSLYSLFRNVNPEKNFD